MTTDITKVYLNPVEKDSIKQNSAVRQIIEATADISATVSGTQAPNTVFAGSTTTSSGAPAFRPLVGADLPLPTASTLGGIESISSSTHQWVTAITTLGVPHQAQPAFTDLSGNIATAQVNSGTGASSTTFFRGDNTWATPVIAQTWTLLNTVTSTSTNAASYDDTTSLTATYDTYALVLRNLVPVANDYPIIQVHTGGAFQTSGYFSSLSITNAIPLMSQVNGSQVTASSSVGGYNAIINVSNPSGTSSPKWWYGTASYFNQNSVGSNATIIGAYNSTAAIDGFRFKFTAQNIVGGVIKVYGITG